MLALTASRNTLAYSLTSFPRLLELDKECFVNSQLDHGCLLPTTLGFCYTDETHADVRQLVI